MKQQPSLFPDDTPQFFKKQISLAEAEAVAEELRKELEPYCLDIVVVGSIRRLRPVVHDIDVVCLPKDLMQLILKLKAMGCNYGGDKLARFIYKEVQVDLYFAILETLATLVLIRTGSKENNIRLCTIARNKGLKLHADGSGLFRQEVLIARSSEVAIYESLDIPFQEPWERD